MVSQTPRLAVAGIEKGFPGIKALDGVSFDVRPGEVHGLLGENGAGKSTMLNVLSGVLKANAGEIRVDGQRLDLHRPGDARAAGIAMIHQELQHIPALTVAQNLYLGRPLKAAGGLLVARRAQEARAREILADLDPTIDPARPIHELKVAQQQIVEIARALLYEAKIIAMDEPTSSLTPSEFESLAALIERLRQEGVSIIYVSHKMDEVFRVCQRATILRDGRFIATVDLAETSEAEVVSRMVGRDIQHERHVSHATATPALRVESLGDGRMIRDASFTLHRGEVLGLAGLVGSGRTELLRLVAGIDRARSGRIQVNGQAHTFRSPREAIAAGIGLVPEERKKDGIVRDRSVASNIALPSMRRFSRMGLIRRRVLRQEATDLMQQMNLRPPNVDRAIGQFSGGNQQKAIIGRWLAADVDILLFDEPTRGIDIGAKSEIYDLIEKLAAQGKAILVVSSELPEILRLSDRVMVMREGQIAATLAGAEITEANIAAHAIPQSKRRGRSLAAEPA
ncbi:monosaccharide ABC transporter ATP-binding protein (CUT2 family) [Limimaricola soesokkakensis]|uniref:Monosaccharide ABC transporter ATP-binding protein (CUT2 family) n=1 Tax=Limimaricola soesokkakensis TaxID=1343159 RepID=A0A1X7A7V6_9RHOB|nr:monosaccharide ABC transporter ATP-binding protein (CUT2 family) [Limimaricola soesokkakensis]SLN71123.1 Ribose import ATP-binding protein RbsA [Limimaricola soesokkakensis]